MYNIIFASTFLGGIGFNNKIPWNIPEEIKIFKKITTMTIDENKKNAIIMGSNTWKSLPRKNKPLPDRINIVISNNFNIDNTLTFNDIQKALNYCENNDEIENIFIIGGENVINQCLFNPELNKKLNKIYFSLIKGNYKCNKFIDIKYILKNFIIKPENIKFTDNYILIIAINNFNQACILP